MEEIIRRLFVQTLRAKLELCRLVAAALMVELESPLLTITEKRAAFRQWVSITRDGDVLMFVLELLRRHERERSGLSSFPSELHSGAYPAR